MKDRSEFLCCLTQNAWIHYEILLQQAITFIRDALMLMFRNGVVCG